MNNPTFIDYISLGVLLVLAITVFIVRILIPDVNNSALVNTLFSFSVVFGMIVQQRLYRERALSAISYTLMAVVGLALLKTVPYFVKLFWSRRGWLSISIKQK